MVKNCDVTELTQRSPQAVADDAFLQKPSDKRKKPRSELLSVGRITVAFEWVGDRWRHCLLVHGKSGWQPIYQSVEGPLPGGDPNWPASAVLVELSRVGRGESAALVAVGLAGRSHFSASIAPDPDDSQAILFEMACRTPLPPQWLGATYSPASSIFPEETPALVIQPVFRCFVSSDSKANVQRIQAAENSPSVVPLTVRWSYRIALS